MTRSSRRSSSTSTAPSPAPAKRRRSPSEPARSIGRGKSARGRNEREGETEDAARRAGAPGRRRGARLDTAAMPPPSTRRRSDADFRNSKKYPLTNRPRTFKILTCASCWCTALITWGCSSAGRASRSQRGGRGFESHHLHHVLPNAVRSSGVFAFTAQFRGQTRPNPGLQDRICGP